MADRKNLIMFFITMVAGAAIFFGISFTSNSNTIDNAPYEGENPNSDERVVLSNGDELFDILQNTQSLDRFTSELYRFAKVAYLPYESKKQPMGFEISSLERDLEKIIISGRYGQVKNIIQVSVIKLNDGQISISITDSKTGLNFDSYLPSNQPKNQLIGALPIDETGYSIRYLKDKDVFFVNVFNDPNNFSIAENIIRDSLGEDLFRFQTVQKYGAGDIQYDNGF